MDANAPSFFSTAPSRPVLPQKPGEEQKLKTNLVAVKNWGIFLFSCEAKEMMRLVGQVGRPIVFFFLFRMFCHRLIRWPPGTGPSRSFIQTISFEKDLFCTTALSVVPPSPISATSPRRSPQLCSRARPCLGRVCLSVSSPLPSPLSFHSRFKWATRPAPNSDLVA